MEKEDEDGVERRVAAASELRVAELEAQVKELTGAVARLGEKVEGLELKEEGRKNRIQQFGKLYWDLAEDMKTVWRKLWPESERMDTQQ